jgi:predicted heme/steroid binding protein
MDDHEAGNRADWCIQPFNSSITKVVVLDKVTWIGDYAFWNLPNLKDVELSSSVSTIGNYAFSGSGLETIVIPDTVTSLHSHIFDGCSKLKNVTLPKGANVGDGMFANCGSITDLDIFDGVNSFGSQAFSGCSGLVDVTIPNSVTSIGSSCFSGCGNLKRLVFSDSIKTVPNSVCNGCGNLEEVVIGSGATYIGNSAFAGCNKLEKAFFNRPSEPNGEVTFAGSIASSVQIGLPFESCTKLYYTGEPEYMGLFKEEWFKEEGVYLKDIQKLYAYINDELIPAKLRWLNKNAITTDYSGDCKVVRNWKGVATVSLRDDGGEGNDGSGRMADGYCNWRVGPQHINTTGVIIEDGVTHIGAESFSDNYIGFITFGADVESIGFFAFAGADVTELNFSSKLKTIGKQAFYGNAYLTKITFSDSITYIGEQAFNQCISLKTAVMPNNLEVLGEGAFEDCHNLNSVMTFSKTVTTIGYAAFSGTGVSEVNLEKYDKDFNPDYNGLMWMTVHMYGTGNAKLYRLNTGTEIIDGGNMGSSGIMATEYIWRVPADYESGDCLLHFDGMYVTVKKNPNSNGNGEMADYANLEDRPWHNRIQDIIAIDFEEGVTRIGDRVFKGMGDHQKFDIKYINLPETGLKTIGDEALQGYIGSVDMRFASSVTYIGNNAIGGEYFGKAIFICPDERSTITLGENAFVDGSFAFERTGSMILYDGETRIPDELEYLPNHTGRTLIWRGELYKVVSNLYEENFNVKVNDIDTQNAGVGDLVTVTFTPYEDMKIKKVSVVQRKNPVSSIQEFAEIIGDNEIIGDDNMVVKVIDDRIVLLKDNEIIYEITSDYSLEYMPSGDNFRYFFSTHDNSDKPIWDFDFNMLSLDVLFVQCEGFIFQGSGNVTTKERDVEITEVSENVYSFIMPDGWAILDVTQGSSSQGSSSLRINELSDNCDLSFKNSENEDINQTNPGEMVKITIDARSNYIFENIFAYAPDNSVTGISQIATLMGKAIFKGVFEEGLDFRGLYCKVNENGNFVVMNGNEIVAELVNGTMDNDADFVMLFTTFTDDENIWRFVFERGILETITVKNKENGEFIFAGSGEVDGILGQKIELTEIEKGKEYTFVVPNIMSDIFVVANYIKTYNINIEETENGNITTTSEGNDVNYAKQNDTITITVEPKQGYVLKELSVLIRDNKIKNIEQLKTIMGDAVFTSDDKTCQISEGGNFVIMQNGSVLAEMKEINIFHCEPSSSPNSCTVYINSNGYDWVFEISNGILAFIHVSIDFNANGEGAGKFEASEEKIPLTTVVEGQKYTFVMPNIEVNIVATFEEHAIPEHEHNANILEFVQAKDATCTDVGNIAYYHCTVCGKYFSDANGENEITLESTVIPALNHNYQFDSFVWNGYTAQAKYVCSHDENHFELHDAIVTNEITTEAKCETTGIRTYTATYDGHKGTKEETITAIGHVYNIFDSFIWTDFTAKAKYICSHDSTHFELHDAVVTSEITTAAKCETTGVRTYTATYDGHIGTKEDIIDALGHDWNEWVIEKEATETEEGLKTRTCKNDPTHVETKIIPDTTHEHNLEYIEEVPATCTKDGMKGYYKCSECDLMFEDGEATIEIADLSTLVINASHTPANAVRENEVAATCENNGSYDEVVYCSVCGDELSRETKTIPALGHDYQFDSFIWDGFTAKAKYICSYDESHFELRDAVVTNEITTEAKCETTGIRTYTATYEGHTDTKEETIESLGHEWSDWVVTKEAQIGVKGEETRTCSRCGKTEKRDIKALPYVPVTNNTGEKVYNEIITEEPKDVTELFAQAKAEDGSVEVKTDELTISFNNDAVNAIGDANVKISAKVSTDNLKVENAQMVLDVTLTGATFEKGKAIVNIPFNKEVPAGKVAKVYYIAGDGTRTDMNATFENGRVTFVTNHFSTYAVVFEDVANTSMPGWGIALIIIGAIILTCGICYLLLFFVFNKWAEINGKKVRIFKLGKKENQVRIITMKCMIKYIDEAQILNSKE